MASIIPTLAPLALLACPIGMALMMLFMSKGMRGGKKEKQDTASVEQLQAEQQRLAAEVERLERQSSEPELTEQR